MSIRGEVYAKHASPEEAHAYMQGLGMVAKVYRNRVSGWSNATHDGKISETADGWWTAVWPRKEGDRPHGK
jgi:hypothetical protein